MQEHKRRWRLFLQLSSAWLIVTAPGICASFSGVALTDSAKPVSGATVRWENQAVCVPFYGTPMCSPPTVVGSTTTASDGSFAANNLPADSYLICVGAVTANQFGSCDWSGGVGNNTIRLTLTANQDQTGLKFILQSGSLIVTTVKDPMNAASRSFFVLGVYEETRGYHWAKYDPDRRAYTCLIPKGITAKLIIDTVLIVQDAEGNSLPIAAGMLPFTATADETFISLGVIPALVNAASYLPGVAEGSIATLFGSGFNDIPGIHLATSLPLPTQILGTSVKVNGIAAPLLAVVVGHDGQDQINFQLPHSEPHNPILTIVVENNGKMRTFYSKSWDSQLGIFAVLAHSNGDPITASSPAWPGEQITIYWTGMNGYNFAYSTGFFVPEGIASPTSAVCASYFNPQVQIGTMKADVNLCSAAPGLVGIGQLVVVVPRDLPSGNYDVAVTMGGTYKGNVVQLPIRIP